jgi:hypothetical protein
MNPKIKIAHIATTLATLVAVPLAYGQSSAVDNKSAVGEQSSEVKSDAKNDSKQKKSQAMKKHKRHAKKSEDKSPTSKVQ